MSIQNRGIMKITVIGESNVDIAVSSLAESSTKGCTPGAIAFHHGGVARNIAHNLCLLGHEVRLVSVFGNDDFAKKMIADCRNIGMDLSQSSQYEAKSPIFLSFNDEMGDMVSAVSDASINDRMDLAWLKGKMDAINESELVVADTLLSAEALAYLIDHCEPPLFIDTVSPGKAMRFVEAMKQSKKHAIFAIKCNQAEAIQITGENDMNGAAKILNTNGINSVYLTIGSSGVIHCFGGESLSYPALAARIVNVTGSGDAFFAGVIHGYAMGVDTEETVMYGLKMAKANCESEDTVNPVLPKDIHISKV